MEISLNHVSCGYSKKAVLQNVNLCVKSGEAVCVLGVNGVGKSTLFKTILGFLPTISGNITIDGRNLSDLSLQERANLISYVPQAKGYSYNFSAREIVLMGRTAKVGFFAAPKQKDMEVVEQVFALLGIEKMADRTFSEMSGGEQQIVLMARAIAQEAKFIIMDEPASNLDFANQKRILEAILKLKGNGTGILMACHMPEHAFMCCEKTMIIKRDKSIEFDDTDVIITAENLTEVFGTDIEILKGLDKNGRTLKSCCIL